MSPLTKKLLLRLSLPAGILLGGLACGGQSCSCAAPLEAPLPEETRLYDAAQARLTPAAFDFIGSNLPVIIPAFLEGGLTFQVPYMREEYEVLFVTIVIEICRGGCTLNAEIVDARITPTGTHTLALDAHVNLSGVITLRNDLDCDVPIHIRNKPVHADINLLRDGIDGLLYFTVSNPQVTISNSDYSIDCSSWFLEEILNLLKSTITDQINDTIRDQLGSALNDAVASATCLKCDYYTMGCPASSSCSGDYCMQAGACRKVPMGMAGAVDFSETLAAVGGGGVNPLKMVVAAGQQQATSADPVVSGGGLELRFIGAAQAERHFCVPVPDPNEIPSRESPSRFVFTDLVPESGEGYMTGIVVSDAMLDWFIYQAHLGGLLCLQLGTETTEMLSSGSLALLGLGSLNVLTEGKNSPVQLRFRPTRVPYAEVGAGTFTTDEQGNRVMEQPLLYLFVPGLEIDFWVLIEDRWMRTVTLGLDLRLELGLDFDQQNRLIPLFSEDSIKLENIRAKNYELLADDPAVLEQLIPTLVSLALPMLTGAIEPIEIPNLEGFVLQIKSIKGAQPRSGTPFFDYLGIWASLSFQPQPPVPVETEARVIALRIPELERKVFTGVQKMEFPEVGLSVSCSHPPCEYSFRVDGSGWRSFSNGSHLLVSHPLFLLSGRHRIEVRSRRLGDYRSLDPKPVSLWVDIFR